MKTLEEISYLHIIEQLQEEVRLLTEENKLKNGLNVPITMP